MTSRILVHGHNSRAHCQQQISCSLESRRHCSRPTKKASRLSQISAAKRQHRTIKRILILTSVSLRITKWAIKQQFRWLMFTTTRATKGKYQSITCKLPCNAGLSQPCALLLQMEEADGCRMT